MNKKINILYWTGHYFGGAEKSINTLVERLDNIKYNPHFVFFLDGDYPQFQRKKGCPVIIIPLSKDIYKIDTSNYLINILKIFKILFEFIKSGYKLSVYIKKMNIDICHTNNIKPALIAIIARIFCHFKLVCHFRGANSVKLVNYIIYLFADKIICISNAVKKANFKHDSKNKINVVYNGIDFDKVRFNEHKENNNIVFSDNKINIGIIGYFSRWKNYEMVIEAAKLLESKFNNWKIFIIGDTNIGDEGYFEELKQLIEKYSLQDKINFTGQRNDIFYIINKLDIIISTSIWEPFGRTIIESMALKKPVIAVKTGGPVELVDDGKTGFLVPLNDFHKLAEKIYDLSINENIRVQFGETGFQKCKRLFNINYHVQMITKIYESLF